jgi:phage-related protein
MSLLSIGKSLLSKVTSTIQSIISEVTKIIDVVVHIRDYTVGVVEDAIALIQEIETEIDAIKNFKLQAQWKHRVISVPKVIDNIAALIALPTTVWDAIKDLISNIKSRITATEAAEAVEEVIPGLGQAAGIVTLIAEILIIVKGSIADLKTVVDAVKTVREDIENFDLIFLKSTNPRKIVTQTKAKIRIGSLHKST